MSKVKPMSTTKKISWTAAAIVGAYFAAMGLSTTFQCIPCVAVLTAYKASLPDVYEEVEISPTVIIWNSERVE